MKRLIAVCLFAIALSASASEAAGPTRAAQQRWLRRPVHRNTLRLPTRRGWRMYKEGDPVQFGRRAINPRSLQLQRIPRRNLMAGPQPEPPRARPRNFFLRR